MGCDISEISSIRCDESGRRLERLGVRQHRRRVDPTQDSHRYSFLLGLRECEEPG